MTTQNSKMFVSKAAATRILKADPSITKLGTIWEVRELKNAVLVLYAHNRKRCSTFISYKKFQQDFIQLRQNGAKQPNTVTTLNRVSGSFLVQFESSDRAYCTTINHTGYACSCDDFQGQIERGNGFTKAVCKHVLAVTYKLGYQSLSEYLKELKEGNKAA